jgi:hypothetical protein
MSTEGFGVVASSIAAISGRVHSESMKAKS